MSDVARPAPLHYVALAVRLGVPLITDDARLAHALHNSGYDVLAFGEFVVPPLT